MPCPLTSAFPLAQNTQNDALFTNVGGPLRDLGADYTVPHRFELTSAGVATPGTVAVPGGLPVPATVFQVLLALALLLALRFIRVVGAGVFQAARLGGRHCWRVPCCAAVCARVDWLASQTELLALR